MSRSIQRLNRVAAAAVTALALAGVAHAQGDKTVYEQARSTAKADYDAARKQCNTLSGNAKDVCVAEARLERTKAESRAKATYEGTPRAQRNAADEVAEAEYELAEERCDDKGGNAKDVCEKDAKAAYERAKAEARAEQTSTEARRDAAEDTREAQREAQAERCDTLAGEAKDACLDRAKNMTRQ